MIPDKWRTLLEPVIDKSLTRMTWAEAQRQPSVVFESEGSVLVANEGSFDGKKALQIWLAAGNIDEVSSLAEQAEEHAKKHGFAAMTYCGRRGWIKTHGYKEVAVVSVKELV
jgi:hypothetical protein